MLLGNRVICFGKKWISTLNNTCLVQLALDLFVFSKVCGPPRSLPKTFVSLNNSISQQQDDIVCLFFLPPFFCFDDVSFPGIHGGCFGVCHEAGSCVASSGRDLPKRQTGMPSVPTVCDPK